MTALADHIDHHRGASQLMWDNATDTHSVRGYCWCGWKGPERPDSKANSVKARRDHADHVAATWQEHRTITTVEDGLDLPDGTVLRDAEGEVHLLHAPSRTPITLPARIIYHPEEDA